MGGHLRTRLAVAYFVVATLMSIWPVYGWLGNHIEPRVLGLPWSLTYVLLIVVANVSVLVALYVTRSIDAAEHDDDDDDGPEVAPDG